MKKRSTKKQPMELARLWGTQWERWQWAEGSAGEGRLLEAGEELPPLTGSPTILAVPARLAMAVPLWIDSTDAAIVEESARLDLDVRGLLGKRQVAEDVVLRTIERTEDRTLVLATVFPLALAEPVPDRVFDRYEAGVFLRALGRDSVTLWREGTDLVAAFTRGDQVIYWETLGLTGDGREIGGWLNLMVLQLRSEGVIGGTIELVNELEGIADEALVLPSGVRRGRVAEGAVMPTLEKAIWRWRPAVAVVAEKAAQRKRQLKQLAYAAAAAYAGIAVILLLFLGVQQVRIAGLEGRAAGLREEVGLFEPVSRQWREVGATAETPFFPLEILHQVVEHLPADGVRMTIFDVSSGRVLVEGEATPSTLATDFFDSLESDGDLAGFQWEMPTPTLQGSAARFQIQGIFAIP